jgi:hypothetical protein
MVETALVKGDHRPEERERERERGVGRGNFFRFKTQNGRKK